MIFRPNQKDAQAEGLAHSRL